MAKEVEVPFFTTPGYSLPLLKAEMECPKIGGKVLIYALPDSGSRFSVLNSRVLQDCYDHVDSYYFDTVVITNLGVYARRYRLKFSFVELGEELEIPVVALDFSPTEAVFPSLILGREDFFSRWTICFEDNAKLIVRRRNA